MPYQTGVEDSCRHPAAPRRARAPCGEPTPRLRDWTPRRMARPHSRYHSRDPTEHHRPPGLDYDTINPPICGKATPMSSRCNRQRSGRVCSVRCWDWTAGPSTRTVQRLPWLLLRVRCENWTGVSSRLRPKWRAALFSRMLWTRLTVRLPPWTMSLPVCSRRWMSSRGCVSRQPRYSGSARTRSAGWVRSRASWLGCSRKSLSAVHGGTTIRGW